LQFSLQVASPETFGFTLVSSAEVKNAWGYTSAHPYVFTARWLIKQCTRLHGDGACLSIRTNLPSPRHFNIILGFPSGFPTTILNTFLVRYTTSVN
jgi:hypothetical protein